MGTSSSTTRIVRPELDAPEDEAPEVDDPMEDP
jgi:hypothetical protein